MDHSYSSTPTTQDSIVPDSNVTNYSQSTGITPAQREPEAISESMDEAPSTDEADFTVVSSRKRKCPRENSGVTRETGAQGATTFSAPDLLSLRASRDREASQWSHDRFVTRGAGCQHSAYLWVIRERA
ncbi:hypothetical protein HPB47_016491 [Ixodes persulcatus]|uniref:Uncharacterized protein n=1 Tax=Ixodes persulcatus TaxID=34615 RepID=A0AC60QQZ7_IXOPE|nr:hypothetical protein HPB47_016491 [Ixodes persulcatus]